MEFIKKFFKLEERGSNVRTEFIAGLTTFLAMSYILVVNSAILSGDGVYETGMQFDKILTATAIAAIVGTLIMGLLANYPVALAPGMGLNAFFTFTVVAPWGFGFTYQQALAAVFVSGLVFIVLSVSGIREKIINAIPNNLKYAVGGGIGLFIAFIGLVDGGIISFGGPVPAMTPFSGPALVAWIGLFITIILYLKKIRGAIFFGIIASSILALIFGITSLPSAFAAMPAAPHWGEFVNGFDILSTDLLGFAIVVFSLLFVDFFDTAGTLVSVGRAAGLVDEEGQLQNVGKALLADSTATVIGAMVGTSNTTSYIESLPGIEEGGRTGLTSVFTALFFFIFMFLSPVLGMVPLAAIAPALIFVGILMASQLKHVEWDKLEVAIPAFLTLVLMPFTYSIANGIAMGFLSYTFVMVIQGKGKEIDKLMYFLSAIFILYFALYGR